MDIDPKLIGVVQSSGGAVEGCVRGAVKACGTPLHSLGRPEICGVYWRHCIKEHLTSQVMGFWYGLGDVPLYYSICSHFFSSMELETVIFISSLFLCFFSVPGHPRCLIFRFYDCSELIPLACYPT